MTKIIPTSANIHPDTLRRVLGNYPTGVAVITATDENGDPAAMTVGTFSSVSLDPPLIAFMPSRASGSWQQLRAAGPRFAVNVLSQHQETLGRDVAKRRDDKLHGHAWHPSETGLPRLEDSVVYIECETAEIVSAGDHEIVLGAVEHLDSSEDTLPLLFYRGGYGSFSPRSSSVRSGISSELLGALDVARPEMEALAGRLGVEITAMCVSEGNLLFAASAGKPDAVGHSTAIGRAVPFMPPLGSVFAAFGDEDTRNIWYSAAQDLTTTGDQQLFDAGLERIRRTGFGFAVGHSIIQRMSVRAGKWFVDESASVNLRELRTAIHQAAEHFNQEDFHPRGEYEVHSLTAPVFSPSREVAFSLTTWFPEGALLGTEAESAAEALKNTAAACTRLLRTFS